MKLIGKVKKLIIHHSAALASISTPENILKWHKEKGLAEDGNAGYHFHISDTGVVSVMRPEVYQGAHCYAHNHESIGLVCAGDFRFEEPTAAQVIALIKLLTTLVTRYDLKYWNIYGHKDMKFLFAIPTTSTQCPGKNMTKLMTTIRTTVGQELGQRKDGLLIKVYEKIKDILLEQNKQKEGVKWT